MGESPEDQARPSDQARFELLDAYMAELHAGNRPDRDALLAEHPELATDLDVIESLDRFLPSGTVLDPEDEVVTRVDLPAHRRTDRLRAGHLDPSRFELVGERDPLTLLESTSLCLCVRGSVVTGTGLGLPIAYQIVSYNQGTIEVRSIQDWTKVIMKFPAIEDR